MADDSKKYPSLYRIAGEMLNPNATVSTSATTATIVFGGDIWKAPEIPVEPPPPDHPVYAFVGKIASDWAHVEHLLDTVIWALARVGPEAGACITSNMLGAYPRYKAIIALLTLHERNTQNQTRDLSQKALELSQKANLPGDQRNRNVHDPWYIYTGCQQPGQFKAMPHKDYRYGVHPVDFDDLKKTLDDIEKYTERVKVFRSDVLKMLDASR